MLHFYLLCNRTRPPFPEELPPLLDRRMLQTPEEEFTAALFATRVADVGLFGERRVEVNRAPATAVERVHIIFPPRLVTAQIVRRKDHRQLRGLSQRHRLIALTSQFHAVFELQKIQ